MLMYSLLLGRWYFTSLVFSYERNFFSKIICEMQTDVDIFFVAGYFTAYSTILAIRLLRRRKCLSFSLRLLHVFE